jgi:hypothetical protein
LNRLDVIFSNDVGKKARGKKVHGRCRVGNWYRSNKKTTTDECQSIDVRYLHRNGVLQPGRSFSLRWSRAGRQTGSIGGVAHDGDRVTFFYRYRRGSGSDWEDVKETVLLE